MKKHWTYAAGSYPFTVTVRQPAPGAPISARWWDRELRSGAGNWTRRSLGKITRKKAEKFADEKHLEIKHVAPSASQVFEPTLANVFALYLKHVTPMKSERVQAEDRRRVDLFKLRLGDDTLFEEITPEDWRDFLADRMAGRIDARGEHVATAEAVRIRPRAARADASWLRSVARWAVGWRVRRAGSRAPLPLLGANPLEGSSFPLPPDKNPRQPVITHDVYLALLAEAENVHEMLPYLLRIANGTGRRLSAMITLSRADRVRTKTADAPFGGICWPEDTDKMRKRWVAPIDADVAGALDDLERRMGTRIGPYFESGKLKGKPVCRDHARKLLLDAYEKAEANRAEERPDDPPIEKPEGSCWHVFRRKFVTERPHMADSLVAALAGMSEQTIRIYRQTHPAGLYEALTQPWRLRELRA